MSKKPYQKKAQTKEIKIFGVTKKSVYFPPDTTLEQGLEMLADGSVSGTAPLQMPL